MSNHIRVPGGYAVQTGVHARGYAPQGATAPYAYVPQGTGLEPAPAAGPPASEDAWKRLWERIPGSYATRSLAIFQLQRAGFRDPDVIVARQAINSDRLRPATGGANNIAWVWDTLSIITAIRGFIDPVGPGTPFDFVLNVRAGSDGGYVFGSDDNPASFTAINGNVGDVLPIPITPVSARPNNNWTGVLTLDAGVGNTNVIIDFYGVALWTPSGQIQ